ncbi:MAG: Exopolysaccharide biosynthesis protein YbjH [Armatimonadetes bacterium]|nr:Exopolysaccharide biosynthesis protein YbjH [Armatimonadota bacterium]
MTMRALILGALLLLSGAPVSAQTLYGPGGLFLHPTASFPEPGKVTPAILVLPQYNPSAKSTRTWISGSVDYGLSRDLEVGATIVKVSGWDRDPSTGGYIKYRLLQETARRPAVALGYTQLGGGDVNARVGFLALKKQVSQGAHPVTTHLGVMFVDEVDSITHHRWEPYAGIEVGLASKLSLLAEGRARTEHDLGTPLALTRVYKPSKDWKLAFTWANAGHSSHPLFGFGAGISLGSRR